MDHRDPHTTRATDAPATTGANGRRPGVEPSDGELDALADLFLGPAGERYPPPAALAHTPDAARRIGIEGVVLGHLPVSAAAWPGQYARARSAQLGAPVAVVRLAAGSLTVDLVGGAGPAQTPRGETDALEFARSRAAAIILRVDEPTEAQLAASPFLDRLSLLTGADDAAIVACYRKLKGIAAAAEESGTPLPIVGLTIMGGSQAKGALVHERIARAARAFLEADLLEPVVIDRIGPTGGAAVYHAPTDLSLEGLGELLTLPRPRPTAASAPGPAATEPPVIEPTPAPRPIPTPGPVATRARGALAPPAANPDALAELVAGLAPMESRCPLAERIELASDRLGRLHLLAAVLSTQPGVSSPNPLGDLLVAAAWAQAHAVILAKAEPQLTAMGGEPTLHLVTDQARQATPLLNTRIRVHVAMPAKPTAFGLVAAPLDG